MLLVRRLQANLLVITMLQLFCAVSELFEERKRAREPLCVCVWGGGGVQGVPTRKSEHPGKESSLNDLENPSNISPVLSVCSFYLVILLYELEYVFSRTFQKQRRLFFSL